MKKMTNFIKNEWFKIIILLILIWIAGNFNYMIKKGLVIYDSNFKQTMGNDNNPIEW